MDYTQKLTYISLRRRNKLIKYKKYMRICLTVFTTSGGICGVLLLLGGLQNSFVGLLGASGFVCLFSSGIYSYLEKKYNKIRAITIESLMRQSPICTCAIRCTCRDDFVRDLDKNHNINLSY